MSVGCADESFSPREYCVHVDGAGDHEGPAAYAVAHFTPVVRQGGRVAFEVSLEARPVTEALTHYTILRACVGETVWDGRFGLSWPCLLCFSYCSGWLPRNESYSPLASSSLVLSSSNPGTVTHKLAR